MTEANCCGLPANPSYAWCSLHRSQSLTRYVHNLRKSKLYTYLGSEVRFWLPLLVSVYNEVWMQFSRKIQLYTYKACKSVLLRFHILWFDTKLKKTMYVYTYRACECEPLCFHILLFICNVRSNFNFQN